ncbi:DNA mismatch repair protein MutS [Desulfobotulus sp. H1]|uniref:DNA mismatch repair protein MutS n=1 Tax=Desulfobotulus pelophilus TaxID=2823377 RepID=A0ABT3NB69_9BACT|nr:DNA mismatch repair protein MutS [Desulfobotulus pelophilus]MCW7754707.1 DNA mismatch repair protein MutS [Desulfobotulus pelophilus]
MSNPSVPTPMMMQYMDIKARHPDCLLFYRMGDFYEMFYDDAETASKALDITLTTRNRKDPDAIPMCGVPVKSADIYMAKLVQNNFKVAICEQLEDPATAKGLVKRDVVRILTPGMLIEDHLLNDRTNNFIVAIAFHGKTWGLACLDLSTAIFRVTETRSRTAVRDELARIQPREILLPEDFDHNPDKLYFQNIFDRSRVSPVAGPCFLPARGRAVLLEQFRIRSLDSYGIRRAGAGVGAAGALLHYVQETQKQDISHIRGLQLYALDGILLLDDTTFRNLEITQNLRDNTSKGSLLQTLDATVTAMGARTLRHWLTYPLMDIPAIETRHHALGMALERPLVRRQIREKLRQIHDLERISTRIVMGRCHPRDLLALKNSLLLLPEILSSLADMSSPLFTLQGNQEELFTLAVLLDKAIRNDAPVQMDQGGVIKPGFHAKLDELIAMAADGKSYLASLEARERDKTGISTLKVRFNRVFGYFIEVSKAQSKSVPPEYVRKQTLVNAERYITDELKNFEDKVLGAQEEQIRMETAIFDEVRQKAASMHASISSAADFLAKVDVLFALAQLAEEKAYVRPEITTDGILDIRDGRHPVVEYMLTDSRYVPNSIYMDNKESQVLIITGPNMAGKSTVLRQVALIVLMAQTGSFVPASSARISVTDRIFTRVGASDNLAQGQSTFMVEMEEAANILHNATADSLVIMDEIGRGTSTFDGLSIAWAVAEYLHDFKQKGIKTLFATHYHEMIRLASNLPRVKNFSVAVREWDDHIIFLHKLTPGGANRSYGIQVAKLAGLPDSVIHRAGTLLARVEDGQPLWEEKSSEGGEMDPDQPRQLSLFPGPEKIVLQMLKETDPNTMTPLEAINFLSSIRNKIMETNA